MGLRCKRCGSEEQVKNGLMRAKQRYWCKTCGLNFTDTPAARHAAGDEGHRCSAVPQRPVDEPHGQVAGRLDPHDAWLEQFAAAYAHKPEPEGRAVVIELDEMWHYLKKSRKALDLESLGSCFRASG